MKELKITDSKIKEALVQIDTITELSVKERGCLRLLTEEMFSMCHELEKSIIANFADDVSIAVRKDRLQMTIIKTV